MPSQRWTESPLFFWIVAILLPPVALVLLWRKAGAGVLAKLAGSVALLVLTVAHLYFVWGLRMEPDGSVVRPIFIFGDRESHYSRLERHRARQASDTPPAESSPAPSPATPSEQADAADPAADVEKPAAPMHQAYWTDYRGPNRDGHYTQTPILTDWPDGRLEELWRQPIGGGYASFVVADGRAFTIEQRRDEEVVAAYDMDNGKELWTNSWKAHFEEQMGGPGPRATPTWDDGRIYALGAEGELRVIDAADGSTVWRKNILEEHGASNLTWAMAAAPLIVGEKLIVQPGGRGASVVAHHKDTGEVIWKTLDDAQAYTSPMLVTLAGRRQLLVVSASRAMGLSVEDGALLWDYPWKTSYDVNAAQPVLTGPGTFVVSAGYGHGAALVRVEQAGDRFEATELWQTHRMKNKFSSSVFHDGYLYGLDEAILACLDAATGELMWKGGRYGYGQVLLADGHLIVTTERGDVALVRATPESHQELERFGAVDGKTWNTPAIAGGRLLVRNTREMVCYRIGS